MNPCNINIYCSHQDKTEIITLFECLTKIAVLLKQLNSSKTAATNSARSSRRAHSPRRLHALRGRSHTYNSHRRPSNWIECCSTTLSSITWDPTNWITPTVCSWGSATCCLRILRRRECWHRWLMYRNSLTKIRGLMFHWWNWWSKQFQLKGTRENLLIMAFRWILCTRLANPITCC